MKILNYVIHWQTRFAQFAQIHSFCSKFWQFCIPSNEIRVEIIYANNCSEFYVIHVHLFLDSQNQFPSHKMLWWYCYLCDFIEQDAVDIAVLRAVTCQQWLPRILWKLAILRHVRWPFSETSMLSGRASHGSTTGRCLQVWEQKVLNSWHSFRFTVTIISWSAGS